MLRSLRPPTTRRPFYITADNATYKKAPTVESMATLGETGTRALMQRSRCSSAVSTRCIRTKDFWIVGIKGAYLYKDESGEKRVGPGEFLRVPGSHKHWSGGDKAEGALFYEEASPRFDSIPAK
jgi:hypothetical protein